MVSRLFLFSVFELILKVPANRTQTYIAKGFVLKKNPKPAKFFASDSTELVEILAALRENDVRSYPLQLEQEHYADLRISLQSLQGKF